MMFEIKVRPIIGNISHFAKFMIEIAQKMNHEVLGEFNEIELRANPSTTVEEIYLDYDAKFQARSRLLACKNDLRMRALARRKGETPWNTTN